MVKRMKDKVSITAIIMTLNEEKNLSSCLDSIQDLCEFIYVVDSGSTDDTKQIAHKYGAEFVFNEFKTHATQFNWALKSLPIHTKWVLRLDADERLSEQLSHEIRETLSSALPDELNGFVLKLRTIFMGRFLRHGGVYPFRKLLLFKFGYASMQDKAMDEHIQLNSGYSREFKHDGFHYDFKSLDYFIKKHNWYAQKEVYEFEKSKEQTRLNSKRRLYYRFPLFLRAKLYFIYRYYFRFGFLDGKEGKIFHTLQGYWYRFLIDSIIYERSIVSSADIPLEKLK